jgi:hypothetical protein
VLSADGQPGARGNALGLEIESGDDNVPLVSEEWMMSTAVARPAGKGKLTVDEYSAIPLVIGSKRYGSIPVADILPARTKNQQS